MCLGSGDGWSAFGVVRVTQSSGIIYCFFLYIFYLKIFKLKIKLLMCRCETSVYCDRAAHLQAHLWVMFTLDVCFVIDLRKKTIKNLKYI